MRSTSSSRDFDTEGGLCVAAAFFFGTEASPRVDDVGVDVGRVVVCCANVFGAGTVDEGVTGVATELATGVTVGVVSTMVAGVAAEVGTEVDVIGDAAGRALS